MACAQIDDWEVDEVAARLVSEKGFAEALAAARGFATTWWQSEAPDAAEGSLLWERVCCAIAAKRSGLS